MSWSEGRSLVLSSPCFSLMRGRERGKRVIWRGAYSSLVLFLLYLEWGWNLGKWILSTLQLLSRSIKTSQNYLIKLDINLLQKLKELKANEKTLFLVIRFWNLMHLWSSKNFDRSLWKIKWKNEIKVFKHFCLKQTISFKSLARFSKLLSSLQK